MTQEPGKRTNEHSVKTSADATLSKSRQGEINDKQCNDQKRTGSGTRIEEEEEDNGEAAAEEEKTGAESSVYSGGKHSQDGGNSSAPGPAEATQEKRAVAANQNSSQAKPSSNSQPDKPNQSSQSIATAKSAANAAVVPTQNPQINKSTIANRNKSLKAKQKIISSKEAHAKNSILVSNMVNKSPQSAAFPNLMGSAYKLESDNKPGPSYANSLRSNSAVSTPGTGPMKIGSIYNLNDENTRQDQQPLGAPPPSSSTNVSVTSPSQERPPLQQPTAPPASFMSHSNGSGMHAPSIANLNDTDTQNKNLRQKKVAKQNSTKTDFFAAKLASAVDDVESSDSDETFVYENNNDDFDYANNTNQLSTLDNISVNGSLAGGHPMGNAVGNAASSNARAPVILEADNDNKTQKGSNGKAHSIANSINSTSHLDLTAFKRPAPNRTLSAFSVSEADGRSPTTHQMADKSVGISNASEQHGFNHHRQISLAPSINEEENGDTYSFNDSDDNMIQDERLSVKEGSSHHQAALAAAAAAAAASSSSGAAGPLLCIDENHHQVSRPQLSSAAPSTISKNTSKKNMQTSTTSSKLRSTTSKLFDKKGSQPRRYSTIPDDVDIEDFDDELIYYDNKVGFPHDNESTSLLGFKHKIPHYRSLNLHYPPHKHQHKRYLSARQPLDCSDHESNTTGKRLFPFPYQESQPQYYYDHDGFDHESQQYDPNFDLPDLSAGKNGRNYGGARNMSGGGGGGGGDVVPPFLLTRRAGKKSNWVRSFLYTFSCILTILTVGFALGFLMATTKELTNFGIVSIENPIVSKDELVFNVVIEAFNPGWFSVAVDEVELDLFARSGYLSDSTAAAAAAAGTIQLSKDSSSKVETVKLGTISRLESTMTFKAGFFSREPSMQNGEIKLLNPGRNVTLVESTSSSNDTDLDNQEKWAVISQNPFDLIITGVFKYILPFGTSTKSVVVRKTGYIDPTLYLS
ncbi:uncharacterized protein LODBEIA_P52470 [Lodderomyces beijingensis]|uniref:Vacuolar segregation protein 7 n=1 Tax=Lodderomyces beijingensis TaxID=1775926 RepID=A0ABP0ZSB2_9ASCO